MEWYEISDFKKRIEDIEQFFVEIAANEEELLAYGFSRALEFPSAGAATHALKTFNEDFSALKRFMSRIDRAQASELEKLDFEAKLGEQVALISLRLRMAKARTRISSGLSAFISGISTLPYMPRFKINRSLFGEATISLHKTIITLEKLRGITGAFWDYVSSQRLSEDEVFKPTNVKSEKVIELIDAVLEQIEGAASLSPKELARIQRYLVEAKTEALLSRPSWPKIVGVLSIVAVVTGFLADAPGAAKAAKDVIEYILGTSIARPEPRYQLAPPENAEPETLPAAIT